MNNLVDPVGVVPTYTIAVNQSLEDGKYLLSYESEVAKKILHVIISEVGFVPQWPEGVEPSEDDEAPSYGLGMNCVFREEDIEEFSSYSDELHAEVGACILDTVQKYVEEDSEGE